MRKPSKLHETSVHSSQKDDRKEQTEDMTTGRRSRRAVCREVEGGGRGEAGGWVGGGGGKKKTKTKKYIYIYFFFFFAPPPPQP